MGMWGVAQSPQKEGFLEMSTLAMIHFSRLSPGPRKGLFGDLVIFAVSVFLLFLGCPPRSVSADSLGLAFGCWLLEPCSESCFSETEL